MLTLNKPLVQKPEKPALAVSPAPETWSPALQTVLDQPSSRLPQQLLIMGILFTGAFTAWAWFGQIDEVAQSNGKLIPQDAAYKVYPIELGKAARVMVKEGDTVKQGDLLVEFDTEMDDKEVERLQTVIQSMQAELLQTEAMIEKIRLQADNRGAIAETQIYAHQATIAQNQQAIQTSRSLLQQLQEDAKAQQARLARLQPLADEGAISREQLFGMEQGLRERTRSITENEGNLQRIETETSRLQSEMEQKRGEARQVALESQTEAEQLKIRSTELRSKIRESEVLLSTAKTKRKQRFIYAPVGGNILSLKLTKPGEVAQPNQPIAEIAPTGKPLVLSTLLPSHEAGFLSQGMPAKIKLDAYPYQDYGMVSGKVLSISADSYPQDPIGQVYRVDITLDRHYVQGQGKIIDLKPGQTASAEIITRRRRIIDLLLEPFKKLQGEVNL